jgi:hypothetical protein
MCSVSTLNYSLTHPITPTLHAVAPSFSAFYFCVTFPAILTSAATPAHLRSTNSCTDAEMGGSAVIIRGIDGIVVGRDERL